MTQIISRTAHMHAAGRVASRHARNRKDKRAPWPAPSLFAYIAGEHAIAGAVSAGPCASGYFKPIIVFAVKERGLSELGERAARVSTRPACGRSANSG